MRIGLVTRNDARLDLEVEPGVVVAELRGRLALLTADPSWAHERLWVDATPLDEDQPCGAPPLVAGALLGTRPGPASACDAAVRAGRHLAGLVGPEAGAVVGLPARRWVTVAPGTLSRHRLHVRGQIVFSAPGAVRVSRRVGRADGPRVRHLRPGPAVPAVVLRDGDRLLHGDQVWELRSEPRATRRPQLPPGRAAGLAVAVAGPLALALATGHWAYLLLALTGPAMLLGAAAGTGTGTGDPSRDAAEPSTVHDLAGLRMAAARQRLGAGRACLGDVPWAADGSLAVTGPLAVATAAGLALTALGTPVDRRLVLLSRHRQRWTWTRWLGTTSALPGPDDPDCLVLAHDPPDPAAVAAWRARAPSRHRLLLVAESAVPAWCPSHLVSGTRGAQLRRADGRSSTLPLGAPGPELLERAARELAASSPVDPEGGLACQVALSELDVPPPGAAEVAAAWSRPPAGLVLSLGRTGNGSVLQVDLVQDGPHLLIGGTTGSGKSELLVTLVTAVALRYPPDRVAMLLVDFKGGTGVGAAAAMPHVLEHLCDLAPAEATRTLTALTAELRRRERLLADAGAADLADLDPGSPRTPPRLLVVIDEFRALLDEVPEAGAVLARLAAQGRALGVHLVLATQRPAGAVGPDLRANVSARLCLRVADPADGVDLVGTDRPARIARSTPGRGLLQLAGGAPVPVQVARALARPIQAPVQAVAADDAGPVPWRPVVRSGTDVPAWVQAARLAAQDRPAPPVPWLPELPTVVRPHDLPAGAGLALALADHPERLARGTVRWRPELGHLLVVGAPGTGRTTALVTAGAAALRAGYQVHGIGLPPWAVTRLEAHDGDGLLGTVTSVEDALVVARLVQLLATGPRRLLLVDGLERSLEALGRLARGAGAERLTRLWTGPATPGLALAAATTPGPAAMRAAPAFADRLVLALRDRGAEAVLEVPAGLAAQLRTPGRAVHQRDGQAAVCQVAQVPDPGADVGRLVRSGRPSTAPPQHPRGHEAEAVRPVRGRRAWPGPVRLVGLPPQAAPPAKDPDQDGAHVAPVSGAPAAVPLGIGGDRAAEVTVTPGPAFLVAGPPGSGRSTALARIATGMARRGYRLAGRDDVPELLDEPRPDARCVLVLDDLDDLEAGEPPLAAALERLLASRPPEAGICVLAAVRLEHAATAFRGPTSALVRARRLLVLDPSAPGGTELLGPAGPWFADPAVRVPGRGVLRLDRDLTAVQVYRPAPADD